jgi:hypothetical protein
MDSDSSTPATPPIDHVQDNHFHVIPNNPSFRLKYTVVPEGSDGSGGTSYTLTENQTQPIALHTSLAAAIKPCLLFLRHIA